MNQKISADMLYNYIQCPHRLCLDFFEDSARRDPETAFMELPLERGIDFEKQVNADMKQPFLDLNVYSGLGKDSRARDALNREILLIYSRRLSTNEIGS